MLFLLDIRQKNFWKLCNINPTAEMNKDSLRREHSLEYWHFLTLLSRRGPSPAASTCSWTMHWSRSPRPRWLPYWPSSIRIRWRQCHVFLQVYTFTSGASFCLHGLCFWFWCFFCEDKVMVKYVNATTNCFPENSKKTLNMLWLITLLFRRTLTRFWWSRGGEWSVRQQVFQVFHDLVGAVCIVSAVLLFIPSLNTQRGRETGIKYSCKCIAQKKKWRKKPAI